MQRRWNVTMLPALRERLDYAASFTAVETERLLRGFEPQAMEYKWLINCDGDWLYFHRSWTGFCIYALRLRRSDTGCGVEETWVNRDPDQYTSRDPRLDLEMLDNVVRKYLLA